MRVLLWLTAMLLPFGAVHATEAAAPASRQEAVPRDFWPLAQNIGQILLKVPALAGGGGEDTKEVCTGLAISRSLVITARHCFYELTGGSTAYTGIIFLRGRVGQEAVNSGTRHILKKDFIENNPAVDLVVLETEELMPSGVGLNLEYSNAKVEFGKSLFILHHPGQGSMVLTRYECQAFDPPSDKEFLRHTCDTSPGSSGAPIFSLESKLVGFHQRGGRTSDPKTFNLALSFERARSNMSKLAAATSDWKSIVTAEIGEISAEYKTDQSNFYIMRGGGWSYRVGPNGTSNKIFDQSTDDAYWEFWRPANDHSYKFPKAGGQLMWKPTPSTDWTVIGTAAKLR